MIELKAGGRWWVVSVQCSVWFTCDIGRFWYLFCLTDERQAGNVDGPVCGNVMFGAWQLWRHKCRRLFGPPRSTHTSLRTASYMTRSFECLVRCIAADCRTQFTKEHTCPPPHRVSRLALRSPMQDAFSLQVVSVSVNRIFSFIAFITACATVCVTRYDHLAMKLGPYVEELTFNHRLWTLISDAWLCKRCLVNQTLIHIPSFYLSCVDCLKDGSGGDNVWNHQRQSV